MDTSLQVEKDVSKVVFSLLGFGLKLGVQLVQHGWNRVISVGHDQLVHVDHHQVVEIVHVSIVTLVESPHFTVVVNLFLCKWKIPRLHFDQFLVAVVIQDTTNL